MANNALQSNIEAACKRFADAKTKPFEQINAAYQRVQRTFAAFRESILAGQAFKAPIEDSAGSHFNHQEG